MRVGAQRSKCHARVHGFEGPGIDLDVVEVELAAEHRWEGIVGPGEQGVAAEFPGVAPGFKAQRVGEVKAVLARVARENRRAANAIQDVIETRARGGGVGERLLQIPGKLGAQG